MKLAKQTLRRMENIKDFCDFDIENRIAIMNVHFNDVEELIDTKRSTPTQPVILEKIYKRLNSYMNLIPNEFKVEFSINVDDYKGYDPETILFAYKNGLKRFIYSSKEQDKTINKVCLFLAVIGIILMIIKVIGVQYEWFGPVSTIIALFTISFLEIFSEVFFEESLVFFILKETGYDIFKQGLKRLHSIKYLNKNITSIN